MHAQDTVPSDDVPQQNTVPGTSTEQAQEEARARYAEGAEAFERGEFQIALETFQEIYEQSRLSVLLFNIASCHDRLNEHDAAVRHYRAYLAAVPDAQNAGYVQSRVLLIEERRDALEVGQADVLDEPTAERPMQQPPEQTPVEHNAPSHVGPIVLIAAGGAAAVGAVVAGVLALSSRSDLDAMCNDLVCPRDAQDTHDAMKSRAIATDILGGAAIALLGAGVIWLLVQPDGSADEPQLSCGLTGCTARVTF